MEHVGSVLKELGEGKLPSSDDNIKIYEKSLTTSEHTKLLMINDHKAKYLLAAGEGELYDALEGDTVNDLGKVCPLSHANRLVLNRYFDYTVPRAFGTKAATMGLGDRLGLASPGHIETVRNRRVKPILAQQSIRELTLTNRTMNDMLDAAAFAVFQEGYKDGYGADGDHIKTEEDIKYALGLGVSMLTLDCSDQIQKKYESASEEEIRSDYDALDEATKSHYKEAYLNKTCHLDGLEITFDEVTLMKNVLLYGDAITYMAHVYDAYISKLDRDFDFEISIDETETITTPSQHFFVANELKLRHVAVASLAPRFCGEFQKGIDYIGDLEQFEKELREHAQIAAYFGYKLSIHSGSDKFSVFPIIAKYTNGVLHVKTAGTNWLEAVRVVAQANPELYRRMHAYALEHVDEALKYYHITPDFEAIKPLDCAADSELTEYMDDDNARQLIHVTYGLLLTAKDVDGRFLFKDEFFQTLDDEEDTYRAALVSHIGRHVDMLDL